MDDANLPKIVIIGRPNVGKSSLYNRIIGRQEAIVLREAGITRDVVTNMAQWDDRRFLLCDTGGLNLLMKQQTDSSKHSFDTKIRERLMEATELADLALFVVDAHDGLTSMDREIASYLRRTGKKVVLVMNKADNPQFADVAYEMYALGFGEPTIISITHNYNIDKLMDRVVSNLPEVGEFTLPIQPDLKIAFVGRPNVGKSSTVNRLLGHDRVIVSEVAGTTRDAIDTPLEIVNLDGENLNTVLIDTAGIRGLRKVDTVVERFSMMRTENAIRRADIVVFITDAVETATSQDKRIARTIQDAGTGCIVLVNKWDLAQRNIGYDEFESYIRGIFPGVSYAPVLFASAKTGFNYNNIINKIFKLKESLDQKVPTSLVNKFFDDIIQRHSPPVLKGKVFKIYYALLEGHAPPTFKVFVNDKELCADNYLAFLRNKLQEVFGFEGLPVKVQLINRTRSEYHDFSKSEFVKKFKRRDK